MDDEEYESFDVNDRDYEYAANPDKRRRRGQTKEEQLYGIWADTEEDEPPARTGFGGYSDPTKGVGFVSAGTSGGDAPSSSTDPPPVKRPKHVSFQSDTPSSSSGMNAGAQIFAGMRSSNVHGFGSAGNSEWTAKPSVMNMMKKMGYVPGKGLGVNKQGIVEPIKAAPRQGKGAVGAYGPEVSAIGQKFGETAAQAQARQREGPADEAPMADQPARGNWKKGRKQAPKLKSLAELVASGTDPIDEAPRQKIIDMTGPEQKVYNDFHTLSKVQATTVIQRKFDIPELSQNLMLLLDMTETEIRRNDRQCKLLQDQNKSTAIDVETIRDELVIEKQQVSRLEAVMELVNQFHERNITSLDEVKSLLQKLRRKFPKEYREYGLEAIALATVIPIMKAHFENWNPLAPDQVEYGMALLEEWKSVLEGETKEKKLIFDRMKSELDALPAFDRCLWEAWIPPMRSAALTWDVRRDSAAMLEVVTTWIPMLPDWLSDNLLEQVIMPRITTFVDQWNPLTDSVPIDSWLLPWHHVLGHRLTSVYAPIRQKLAKALREWIPTDGSAYAVLAPWKNVFTHSSMSSFLNMNIVPKLERALMEMNMNPIENTAYLEFYALLSWMNMIGVDVTSQVLLKVFFPRALEYAAPT
uniref:G-patch domain-containing protein n=1 Tax=Panagrellus redivivus TaxID=6233 RepID=A0A7E4V146_PANRE